jgi:hypothetical protein
MAKIDNGAQAATEHGIARSPKWHATELAHLKAHPYCEVCGPQMDSSIRCQVHHVVPFHFCILLGRGYAEIDDRNLITLCETEEGHPSPNHHLRAGHSGDFQSSNINIRQDVSVFFRMDEGTIEKNAHYLENVKNRLKPWAQMTDQDKADLTALIDRLYPLQP